MTINNKEYIIKAAISGAVISLIIGSSVAGVSCYNKHQEQVKEQQKEEKHQNAQKAIRAMIAACDFSVLAETEQASIDKCGDDVEAARYAISRIVDDRIVFWNTRIGEVDDRMGKLLSIKNNATYWSNANEAQFKEVGQKLIKDFEQAKKQVDYWKNKKAELNKVDSKSTSKSSGMKV